MMKFQRGSLMVFIFLAGCLILNANSFAQAEQSTSEKFYCEQSSTIRDPLIRLAESEQFNVKYVYFVGNTYTRGRELFRRTRSINEGDIFTRQNLELALKRLSKMTTINKVKIDDVVVTLNTANTRINITICVKQKPKL